MALKNSTYDVLKYITQIVIPAIATLYFALAKIWGFPYAAEIVGTLTAIDAFLGALLGISTAQYKKKRAEELSASFKKINGEDDGK